MSADLYFEKSSPLGSTKIVFFVFFAGIDFISEKLNGDINVTSPTGLKNYFDLKISLIR